jgi:hypothetical protein
MVPLVHAPSSAVAVCAVVSLLVHVTVPPALTTIGLGAYAVVVMLDAPATIDTADPPPVGDGEVGAPPE